MQTGIARVYNGAGSLQHTGEGFSKLSFPCNDTAPKSEPEEGEELTLGRVGKMCKASGELTFSEENSEGQSQVAVPVVITDRHRCINVKFYVCVCPRAKKACFRKSCTKLFIVILYHLPWSPRCCKTGQSLWDTEMHLHPAGVNTKQVSAGEEEMLLHSCEIPDWEKKIKLS